MYREHFSGERVMAEDPHTPKRNRRISSHRPSWYYRICMLLILTLFGLHLLSAGSVAGSGESLSVQQIASGHTHELRNEVVEEFISDLRNESCAEREAQCMGGSRNWGMESQRGRR